jgi:nifR3 family TIM-barrel protein
MKIGRLHLDPPVVLAPLAGISNLPFRLLAREAGCALVTTEMVSADGLVHGAAPTFDLLRSLPQEKPLAVQLFGSDPEVMAAAAAMAADSGADVLDINFGCAVRKIVRAGAGVALMRDPRRAEAILQAVRKAVAIPVTIKIRSGWDRSGREALAIGAIAEACGVDAVTLHPRTAAQKFAGRADWTRIAALKEHLRLPVIGNGDIRTAEDALRMMAETGCDAVMIGRASMKNPWIYRQVVDSFEGRTPYEPTLDDRRRVIEQHFRMLVDEEPTVFALHKLRTFTGWYTHGLPAGRGLRLRINGLDSPAAFLEELARFFEPCAALA